MKPIEILTPKALADRLGVSYNYVRQVLVRFQKGEITSWKGYTFFGERNKNWYAYDESMDLRVIDSAE